MDGYRKFYSETSALNYQHRKPKKHNAELLLIDRAFKPLPRNQRVLDAACGGGRVMVHLAGQGFTVEGADVSASMVEIARKNVAANYLDCAVRCEDVEKLSYPDRTFDTTVCFRLFHHFPNAEIRRCAIRELCRVARCHVVLSYFSPWSFTSLRREIRAQCGGKKEQVHATPLREIENYFQTEGFRLLKDLAQAPLLHTLHLAVFARIEP